MFSSLLKGVLKGSEGRKESYNGERKTEHEGGVGCLRWISQEGGEKGIQSKTEEREDTPAPIPEIERKMRG